MSLPGARPDLLGQSRVVRRTPQRPGSVRKVPTSLFLSLFLSLFGIAGCGASADPGTTSDETSAAPITSEPPSRPSSDTAGTPVDADTASDRWSTEPVTVERNPAGTVVVTDVRAARHDDFDRVVITLSGDNLPTYRAQITTGPATQCGSGETVSLSGLAVLILGLQPAQAHDDAGNSTIEPRDIAPALPALLEGRLICDFEGHVEWAFGIADATAFRVLELSGPTRIAVDIQH
jgi:hypothetical protein